MKKLRSRGAALTDYGLIVGLVALGTVVSVATTGDEVVSAFCKASNGMLQITSGEQQPWCIEEPNDRVTLAEGERFVVAPVQMQADFTDMLFANSVTGEQMVMSALQEAPAKSFWLDTELNSRDPHEADRQISSCYILEGGADPICAAPGAMSSALVPVDATAFGYTVTLSEDTDMPWANDVEISVRAADGVEARNWSIEVAREEAEAVLEGFSVAFGPHTYKQTDTGWTYGAFAPIEGKFNRPLQVQMGSKAGNNYTRRNCYLPDFDAEPICSLAYSENSTISLEVAPGAVALGYEIDLPATRIGPDWVVEENFRVIQNAIVLHTENVAITRPNEPYQPGTFSQTLSSPYNFAQTDTGWTEAEFITLGGERNVDLEYYIYSRSNYPYQRQVCFKLEVGGLPDCGNPETGRSSTHYRIPPEAVEVGYMVQLPAESVGPAHSGTDQHWIRGGTEILIDKEVTWSRPNEPYATGSMAFSFTDHEFAQTDSGWTEGEFIAINGERNVSLDYTIMNESNYGYSRKACFKTVAGGTPDCGVAETGRNWARHPIPPEAVEVGYMVQLPSESVGPAHTGTDRHTIKHGSTYLVDAKVIWSRPNEPYQIGSMAAAFSDHEFAQTDSGWTEGEFITISGDRNVNLDYIIQDESNYGYNRKACFKTVAGGTPDCGNAETGREWARHSIPPEAIEVGYMVQLPSEAVGPAHTGTDRHYIRHGGTYLVDSNVTWSRPNAPYQIGSMATTFSDHEFAQTDSGWTEGEFIAISGERNVNLDYIIQDVSDYAYNRKACFKTVPGGAPNCGVSETGRNWARHSIPPEAVEVGYMVSLPSEAVGPAHTGTDRHYIRHGTTYLVDTNATWSRPNEPYQFGGVAEPFTDHIFAASDSGWTEGQFIALTGERNVSLDYYIYDRSGYGEARKACYKAVAGGEPICGNQATGSNTAYTSVPLEAVEVGYMVANVGVGSQRTGTDLHYVRFGGNTLTRDTVIWTRPSE